jgi:hypothetical protein
VPFGLPVLVEVPALAQVLSAIDAAEQQMLRGGGRGGSAGGWR